MRVAIAVVVVLLLSPNARAGQEPVKQPLQELFLSEVVYPQERGEFQFTFGSSLDRPAGASSFDIPISLEYGLSDRWEVSVGWRAFTHVRSSVSRTSSVGGLMLGTKYSVMQIRGSGIHVAVGAEVELPGPRTSDATGAGTEAESYAVVATEVFDGRATVFGQLSAGVESAGGPEDDESANESRLTWNVGALAALGRATLATELMVNGSAFGPGRVTLTPSATFMLPNAWEIGVGVPIGLRGHGRPGLVVHAIYER